MVETGGPQLPGTPEKVRWVGSSSPETPVSGSCPAPGAVRRREGPGEGAHRQTVNAGPWFLQWPRSALATAHVGGGMLSLKTVPHSKKAFQGLRSVDARLADRAGRSISIVAPLGKRRCPEPCPPPSRRASARAPRTASLEPPPTFQGGPTLGNGVALSRLDLESRGAGAGRPKPCGHPAVSPPWLFLTCGNRPAPGTVLGPTEPSFLPTDPTRTQAASNSDGRLPPQSVSAQARAPGAHGGCSCLDRLPQSRCPGTRMWVLVTGTEASHPRLLGLHFQRGLGPREACAPTAKREDPAAPADRPNRVAWRLESRGHRPPCPRVPSGASGSQGKTPPQTDVPPQGTQVLHVWSS